MQGQQESTESTHVQPWPIHDLPWPVFSRPWSNLKFRFVSEKKKNIIISEMSWCDVLQRTGSDFVQLIISEASSSIFVS